MNFIIVDVMMLALELRGRCFIRILFGGSAASANAAKVSMMRLTHNICVTVSAGCLLKNEHTATTRQAHTLTVSWNRMKRWILL